MSKKDRHITQREKRHLMNTEQKDLHHICFQRKLWCGGMSGALRKYPYCKIYIERITLHHLIHAQVINVPPPKAANAKSVLRQLMMLEKAGEISDEDSFERRLNVLIGLFDRTEKPTANALRAQLAVVHKFNLESST